MTADPLADALRSFLPLIGADAGFLGLLSADGGTIDVLRVTPWSEQPVRLSFPSDGPYPLAEAIRSDESLFITSNEQLRCDHPGLVRVRDDDHACASLPLRADDGTVLGALNFGFEEPHPFTEDERRRIEELGERCRRLLVGLRTRP
jgi:GAF domain-containing protein